MRNSRLCKKLAASGAAAIIGLSVSIPAQAVENGTQSDYECSYATYPVRSINRTCDYGIQHVLITFMQTRYGQVVGPYDDFGDGVGVSKVHLVSTEAVGISKYWTRVFHS